MQVAASAHAASTTHNRSGNAIKVMVVDDSAVVRGLVTRWIEEDPGLEVVARHGNGKLAVDDIAKSKPDVVILDIEMPVMDGLTALPLLLKNWPAAKVIMASTLTRRNAEISLKALSLGATEYLAKPESNRGVTTSTEFRRDLINKVKAMCGVRVRAGGAAVPARPTAAAAPAHRATGLTPKGQPIRLRRFANVPPRILAVGSSTGGPEALQKFVKAVSPSLNRVPLVITQHMPPTFTAILAEHLGQASGRPSKEGQDGEMIKPGCIYVAPGGRHMILEPRAGGTAIKLTDGPQVNFCKPAVDPLFESVSSIYGGAALAVVLTGMGQDGAAGALKIADAGGSIIAQDEATSVVWGMPGATAEIGACAAVLPIQDIGTKVSSILRGAGG